MMRLPLLLALAFALLAPAPASAMGGQGGRVGPGQFNVGGGFNGNGMMGNMGSSVSALPSLPVRQGSMRPGTTMMGSMPSPGLAGGPGVGAMAGPAGSHGVYGAKPGMDMISAGLKLGSGMGAVEGPAGAAREGRRQGGSLADNMAGEARGGLRFVRLAAGAGAEKKPLNDFQKAKLGQMLKDMKGLNKAIAEKTAKSKEQKKPRGVKQQECDWPWTC